MMATQNTPAFLSQPCGQAVGRKLARLLILPADQIDLIVSGVPILRPGAKPTEIEVAGTSATVSETEALAEPGAGYAWAINFSLSKARPEIRRFILQHGRRPWVAFIQTIAGDSLMMGSPEFPLLLQAATSIGGGANQNGFQLTGRGPEPAGFLPGLSDDQLSGGVFDANTFSEVFEI
ncbi:hypothetical protein [Siphonobacter curvatus]|uniref:Uncharacterized protein n=1 Tax=Siphonobacter curvatus TaxID=2094562 RepID=A0A2S7IND4_9BACT|nr:hypothetical protein [Siphonobacter curvatus]PQA59166.1 hypothetical protein C5O19_05785 [Siphonobacter curvatus]